MVQVISGRARFTRDAPTSVVLRVLSSRDRSTSSLARDESVVRVNVADAALEKAIARAVRDAVVASIPEPSVSIPIARFKTDRRLTRYESDGRFTGVIAIIAVTSANSRRLGEYVDRALAAGAVGAQLVWDGAHPPPGRTEEHVFAVLEKARSHPKSPPVMLSRDNDLLEILMLTARARLAQNEAKR